MKWELCGKNPCHMADTSKVPKSSKRSYHPDEMREIVDALLSEAEFILEKETQTQGDEKVRRYKRENSKRILNRETLRNIVFILVDLSSGCRKGEILGLEWKDVNFQERTISIERVSQNVTGIGLITKDMPKNDTSIRKIVMPRQTMQLLRKYKKIQDRIRAGFQKEYVDTDRVFTQNEGKGMSYNSINKWYNKFTEDYGFRRFSIHELRHTHISNLIHKKMDIVSVSKRAGHSSPTVTLNTYAHAMEGSDKKVADVVEKLMF